MATFCLRDRFDRALVTPLTASKRPLAPFATFRDAGSSQSIYLIYLSTIFDPVTARFRVLQAGCLVKSGVKKCESMSVCAEIPARERPRLFVVSNELLSQREEKSAVLPPRFGDTKQRTYRRHPRLDRTPYHSTAAQLSSQDGLGNRKAAGDHGVYATETCVVIKRGHHTNHASVRSSSVGHGVHSDMTDLEAPRDDT